MSTKRPSRLFIWPRPPDLFHMVQVLGIILPHRLGMKEKAQNAVHLMCQVSERKDASISEK